MAYCTNPNYFYGLGFTACGKCPGCLKNKRKEWADRLKIEMRYHTHCYFCGLTFTPEFLPEDNCLRKKHLQDFKKRLAYHLGGYMPRTFGCGEYGDESERMHYHIAIFADRDCFDAIRAAWTFGNVSIDHMTPGRCDYICGYVTKKMTSKDDPRLKGRTPEFYLASRKPALGYDLLCEILDKFAQDEVFRQRLLTYAYPPSSVRMGGKWIRLPRYIRDKLKVVFKEYNREKQEAVAAEKKRTDAIIKEKIRETVSPMPMSWKQIREALQDKWKEREELDNKATKLRKRRYL